MAQHVSIRIPWKDNDFIGAICNCPLQNFACKRLKTIGENTHLLCQDIENRSREINSFFEQEKKDSLPCISESGAFMADVDIIQTSQHQYKTYNYSSHAEFISGKQNFPAYSLVARPFRWLMYDKGDRNAGTLIGKSVPWILRHINGISDKESDVDVLLMDKKKGRVGGRWIQNWHTQEEIFTTFFKDVVPGKSLCFIYAKAIPYVEDGDRILVGVAVVDKPVELPVKHRKQENSKSKLESYTWECMVQHRIRKDNNGNFKFYSDNECGGFILPYGQIIKCIEENSSTPENKEKYVADLQDIVVNIPAAFREEFSYASEHVNNDTAISVLTQLLGSLEKIISLRYINGNYVEIRNWVKREIDRLWQEKEVFPNLGVMLSVIMPDIPGKVLADEVLRYSEKNKQNIFDVLCKWVSDGSSPNGIKIKNLDRASFNRMRQQKYQEFMLMCRVAVPYSVAYKAWQKVEDEKIDILSNPYSLTLETSQEKDAVPLFKADLAFFCPQKYQDKFFPDRSIVDSADDICRGTAFIAYVLNEASNEGHTYLPEEDVFKRVAEIPIQEKCVLNRNVLNNYKFMDNYSKVFDKYIHVIEKDGTVFYKLQYFEELDKIIREIVDKREKASFAPFNKNFEIKLPDGIKKNLKAEEEQKQAAKILSESAISVLTGAAGTGKTTVLANLCNYFGGDVLLLAPTGKASVRMQESIYKGGGGKMSALTIAGYLNKLKTIDGNKCYNYVTGKYELPIAADTDRNNRDVIIDESSMITEDMFAALLVALQYARRIIFVGDVSQLPPIGAGKPFYELAEKLKKSGYGFAELQEQVRFGSFSHLAMDVELSKHFSADPEIRQNAHEEVFDYLDEYKNDKDNQNERLSFVFWNNPDDLREKLLRVLRDELNLGENEIDDFNIAFGATISNGIPYFNLGFGDYKGAGSFADKWQILSPLRNRQDIGTVGINEFIHDHFRKDMIEKEISKPYSKYILPGNIIKGDKVINLINKEIETTQKNKKLVANGEIGIVGCTYYCKISGVEFSSQPKEIFKFTTKDFTQDSTPLELAYAITVHKSQGSDFDTVILIMGEHIPLSSREMLYTALTRQRKRLVVLYNGDVNSLRALKNDSKSDLLNRYSNLFTEVCVINRLGYDKDDGRKHKTKSGIMVRSKSEVIVANLLTDNGIEYEYEKPLKLIGRETPIKPDFTFKHKGKTYYWEHLGMMVLREYRDKWEKKLKLYRSNEIEPIVSEDGDNGDIDSKKIEETIKRILA